MSRDTDPAQIVLSKGFIISMADEGLFMFGDDLETTLELLEGDEAMEKQFVSAVGEVSKSYSI